MKNQDIGKRLGLSHERVIAVGERAARKMRRHSTMDLGIHVKKRRRMWVYPNRIKIESPYGVDVYMKHDNRWY